MMRLTRHALVVLLMGLMLSGCADPQANRYDNRSSHQSGHSIAGGDDRRGGPRYDITLEQLRKHVQDKTARIIDARSQEQFSRGHVRGALNVPAAQVDSRAPEIEKTVRQDQFIIVYCGGPSCGAGDKVYDSLAARGFSNMRVYHPGWERLASEQDLH